MFPRGHWEKIKHETLGSCPLPACLFPFQPFVSDCSFDYIITSSLGAQLLYFFFFFSCTSLRIKNITARGSSTQEAEAVISL